MISTSRDITEHKRAEDELRNSEARFRALAENSRADIVTADGDRVTYANPRYAEMTGYTVAELLNMNVMDLVLPDSRQRIADQVQARLPGEAVTEHYEIQIVTKQGEMQWIEIASSRTMFAERPLILSVVLDITDRKRAERNLQESEARFRALAEKSRAGIMVTEGARFTYVNPKYIEITGYTKAELLRRGVADMVVSESRQMISERREARLRGEAVPEQYETQIVTKRGETRWIEVSATTVIDITERPAILSTVVDITERKQAEQALGAAEAELQHAQKMEIVGRLAGSIAHDFNNLLTIVVGHSDLLLRSMRADDPHHGGITAIAEAADLATTLTQQLLGLSRRDLIRPRVLRPNKSITGVKQLLLGLIGEHIRFVVDLHPDVGNIRIDPNQLEQVLINLAVNARDAMPDGGVLTVATLNTTCDAAFVRSHRGAREGAYVAVSVSDTGHGMDEATAAQVFEPFYTTKPRHEGTGLGLATVHDIVTRGGGFVTLETAPGQGATVTACFPQVDAVEEPVAPRPSSEESVRGTETILIVEDDTALRAMLGTGLGALGYTALTACDGPEALEICAGDVRVALLLTDVVMPGMNGRALMEQLTARVPGLKTLFMSGFTNDILGPQGALDAETLLLRKPFTVAEAAGQIRQALGAA